MGKVSSHSERVLKELKAPVPASGKADTLLGHVVLVSRAAMLF